MVFVLIVLALLGLAVFAWQRRTRRKADSTTAREAAHEESAYQVSYAPPEFEWSGTTTGALPLKTLTYKQYECLEDAR
ncbi:MAG: hypothetical protein Q8M91_12195, partial [Polaromonas sp.]|nr:hypothetical protein [Polaromonas sp.]